MSVLAIWDGPNAGATLAQGSIPIQHDVFISTRQRGEEMLDRSLRPVKEGILHPFVAAIPPWISPNFLTYVGFAVGLAAPLFSLHGDVKLALAAWLTNRLMDGLDGTVARLRGKRTAWGGYIDIVCDFTIYSLLPIGAALSPSSPPADQVLLPLAFLLGSFHVNNVILFYLASAIPQTTEEMTSLQMVPALVEGSESFCLFTLMVAFPAWFVEIAYGMAGLVGINIVQRTLLAKRAFEEADKRSA